MSPNLLKTSCTGIVLYFLFCNSLQAQEALTNEGASIYLDNAASLYVQGNLENKSSGSFTNNGTISVSGDIIHNGSTNLNNIASGTFLLNGSSAQTISGSRTPDFYNLQVNKSGGLCELQTNLYLSNQLTLTDGSVFLNNRTIDLVNSGSLIGETSSNRVYDNINNNGTIRVTQVLNAPSAVNPGNLGAVITSSQNLGATTITRGSHQQFVVSANSIGRYYDIVPANNSGLNAALRFNYLDAELNALPEDELIQWYSPNNGIVWQKTGGTLNMPANYVERTGIDSFARVTLASNKILPLPLTLLLFTAIKQPSGKVELTWKTAQEINVSHFDIERSSDGKKWYKMGVRAAKGHQGSVETYNIIDDKPAGNANYYRLHVIDFDYKSDYSPVRLVNFGSETPIKIYPTLTRSNSTLYVEGISPENALVELFDNKGQMIQKIRMYSNTISLPGLATGIYHIRITNTSNNSNVHMQQVVII